MKKHRQHTWGQGYRVRTRFFHTTAPRHPPIVFFLPSHQETMRKMLILRVPGCCKSNSVQVCSRNYSHIPIGLSGNGKVREAKCPIIHRADTVPPPPIHAPGEL